MSDMANWWSDMMEAYGQQVAEKDEAEKPKKHGPPSTKAIDKVIDSMLEARSFLTEGKMDEAYERIDFSTRQLFNIAGAMLELKVPEPAKK